ncbi:MAG: hypothetical protein RJA52_700, partial [Bacteroidota bacterium]
MRFLDISNKPEQTKSGVQFSNSPSLVFTKTDCIPQFFAKLISEAESP